MTWERFKTAFLEKYFPADVRCKKEMEFLELKQGNMSVADYASKFEELVQYCPHYNNADAEESKCVKFENGLRPEIKQGIGYQEIRRFPTLVNKCRIFDEDSKARTAHYKSLSEKKNKDRGSPYASPNGKGKQKVADEKKPSGGESPIAGKCFRCGEPGHRADSCTKKVLRCFRCGQAGHRVTECKDAGPTCFNCGEKGHISSQCSKPKKAATAAHTTGRVFALSGAEAPKEDNLIKGTCLINNVELLAIVDTGATHSFISYECATRIGVIMSSLGGSMVIDTPANGSVKTSVVCRGCHLTIFEREFVVDLVCLPLHQIDIILGMNC